MKTYDPRQLVLSIGGLLIARGFSEESMIKVTQTSPRFESVVGVDGEVTRVRIYDGRATALLSLMQSSEANTMLSNLHLRDINVPNGAGVGAFLVQDLNGDTLVKSPWAWIKGLPETEFGKKVGMRAWEIELANNDTTIVGGSLSTT